MQIAELSSNHSLIVVLFSLFLSVARTSFDFFLLFSLHLCDGYRVRRHRLNALLYSEVLKVRATPCHSRRFNKSLFFPSVSSSGRYVSFFLAIFSFHLFCIRLCDGRGPYWQRRIKARVSHVRHSKLIFLHFIRSVSLDASAICKCAISLCRAHTHKQHKHRAHTVT